jgi:type IV pilus assembly protein PilE
MQRGMTLMELLVVVMIVGIVAAIAIPSYRQYAVRTYRTDAKVALTSRAASLERCFTRYTAYNSPNCTAVTSLPETVESGRYEVRVANLTATTFLLRAVPLDSQAEDDTQCATFTMNQAGERDVTGSLGATPEDCWKR